MNDQHYRQSLGLPVDPDKLHMEASAYGFGAPLADELREGYSTKDGSDLRLEKHAGGHPNDELLDELQGEIYSIASSSEQYRANREYVDYLEAKSMVLQSERSLDELATEFPTAAEVLKHYLFDRLAERQANGDPIDDEMWLERAELAAVIAEANPDMDAYGLLELAEEMTRAIEAQAKFKEIVDQLAEVDEFDKELLERQRLKQALAHSAFSLAA